MDAPSSIHLKKKLSLQLAPAASSGLSARDIGSHSPHVGSIGGHHKPGHGSVFHKFMILIDGLGLSLIAVCTFFEGVEDWHDGLRGGLESSPETVLFWVCGLLLAIFGLFFLIFHAAAFETVPDFEHVGMAMLTSAPLVNMCAWSMFDSGMDPTHFYNKQWMATEVIEWAGMTTLCISYIDADRYTLLVIELAGFFLLACAAMLNVIFLPDQTLPKLELRNDYVHIFDCFGLLLLCVVSGMQCYLKGLGQGGHLPMGGHNHSHGTHHGGAGAGGGSSGVSGASHTHMAVGGSGGMAGGGPQDAVDAHL